MLVEDPNAYLGYIDPFVLLLLVCITLFLGTIVASVGSRIAGISPAVPLAVFLWYFAVGLVLYFAVGPFSLSGDGITYDQQAVAVGLRMGMEAPLGFDSSLHWGKWGFPIVLGSIYALVGRMPIAGILLNCIVVALVCIVILATAKRISGNHNSRWVLGFMLMCPSFVTLGPAVMREAFCWLGIAAVIYGATCWYKGSGFASGTSSFVVGLTILAVTRTSLAALVIVALGSALATMQVWMRFQRTGLVVYLTMIGLGVLLFGTSIFHLAGYDATSIMLTRAYLSEVATTGFIVHAGPLSVFGPMGALVASIPKVLLGPLPWELSVQLVWGWVVINAVFWWTMIVAILRRRRAFSDKSMYVLLTVFAMVLLIGMAATLTNYGILSRLRSLPMVVGLIVLSTRFPAELSNRGGINS